MLIDLGLDAVAEMVYREMLARPGDSFADLVSRLGMSEEELRGALDRLSELTLIRASPEDPSHVHAVSPHLGIEILLARQQAELAAQQQRVEGSRAAAARLISEFAHGQPSHSDISVHYLEGLDSIRDYLAYLNNQVEEEFLTFAPGGAQTSDNMRASQPLNKRLLERGVHMRTIYLDSILADQATAAHAEWLISHGALVRTAPSLPNRMIICDRQTAIIAVDSNHTEAGAIVVTSPGLISSLVALFESEWRSARPLSEPRAKQPGELTPQQVTALHLLAEGATDEAIARKLGVSPRTARRISTGLLSHLNARSRFQAGVHAVQDGYLPATAE
ncbi:helix-turn-helix transcriptional regulator [Streptomyces sp. PRKS01-65]|nr:LuxR C-terminal-related transcriptional regulator [Streptomyces harenosi]NEY34017.1 helix-turn-helix transcriptional regulator [Streptomyces harenosi]